MKKLKTTKVLTVVFMVVFTLVFTILFSRLIYIQASGEVDEVDLKKWADKQRTTSYSIPAERGKIYDRTGMVLADNRPSYRIYAIIDEEYSRNSEKTLHVKDPIKTANQLAPLLNLDTNWVASRLQEGIENEKFQVEFGPNGASISEQTKKEIEALELPGIYFSKHLQRYYPNGKFASHLIGFTQKQQDEEKEAEEETNVVGAMGIEKSMDTELRGKDGHISYQRDNYAAKLLDPEEVVKEPENGVGVYLTLDQKIQTFLEDAMSDVQEQYKPEKIVAVVMNPKTGEVLAMGNRPSFNPNSRENIGNWYNDVISYPFEPGSTMKIFTVAAAIDAGVYKGKETFQSGTYKFMDGARPVHDHNYGKGWGPITFNEGFRRSSNVAVSKLVWEKLGTDKFLDYLHRFDFEKKTGIDLAGEIKGKILYNWPAEKVTTSYGQGSTTTPMQLMKAATAIANDGKMLKPYVISKTVDSKTGKVVSEKESEVVGEPINAETAKQVRDLMESVVTAEDGTGQGYQLEDYSVAGKTGTAQIPDPDPNRSYLTGRENYIFSFLGMAPKENPELMMYVAVEKPELDATEVGSEPVSYIFKSVMENSLHYLNISPDMETKQVNVDSVKLPNYEGKSVQSVKQELAEQNSTVRVIGDGNRVAKTIPKAGEKVLPGSSILLLTDSDPVMPDLTAWSLREVLQLGQLLSLKVEHSGTGYTVKQSIAEGASVPEGSYLSIQLEPPNQPEQEKASEEGEEENKEQSSEAETEEG
ncbi:penicillin-binding protein [Salinibacillus xinjiangensis]|uniref:serine-type D-Ala-D-Ala carboxypeptidase n=1 Tax=Salinibacillus xinjiangensis TaxID=1229268 RepID=A0A6G1X3U2_9BACI|nr:penicillin-binding protein [Salinibacillus xinjiangensis]MRG85498.1 PASTA domain-containing protein [Salinibacillus xinjiangensis]